MHKRSNYFFGVAILAVLGLGLTWAGEKTGDRSQSAQAITQSSGGEKVDVLDDCDPTDPAWDPTGGCTLRKGDVTFDEFFSVERLSPLALSIVGHQGWRNDPPYLKIEEDETVRVRNRGGRGHTFTEVRAFGGGIVAPLNVGLTPAPECEDPAVFEATVLDPGARLEVKGLRAGNHRFQCCIHPWMRALIKVKPEDDEDD